ncbi:MAG: hypothetical protein ACI9WO_001435 [Sphingobacteriales bacterium]|jgi:hypothetical protein
MPRLFQILLISILFPLNLFAQQPEGKKYNIVITGKVVEQSTQEPLWGVSVFLKNKPIGTVTNSFGYYALELPSSSFSLGDSIVVVTSYLGYKTINSSILLIKSSTDLGITKLEKGVLLQEIVVNSSQVSSIEAVQVGKVVISGKTLNEIPSFLGERDVIKGLKLLPGIEGGNEGTTGIFVRGGGIGENLILLEGAPVYNSGHLLGFFSAFPSEPIKQVEVYKGGFPAKYAGRTSSVIDIQVKEGDKKQITGTAGIGIIGSNVTVEGPIKEDTSSFIISLRRTYFDLFSAGIPTLIGADFVSGYYFYDGIAKVSSKISERTDASLSLFSSTDKFYSVDKSDPDSRLEGNLTWGNLNTTLNVGTRFTPRLFGKASLTGSRYSYEIQTKVDSKEEIPFEFANKSGNGSVSGGYEVQYLYSSKHKFSGGFSASKLFFFPEEYELTSSQSGYDSARFQNYTAAEYGVYVEDNFSPNANFNFTPGIRLASFNIQDKSYVKIEPRLNIKYRVIPSLFLFGSYARMNQFILLLTNSGTGLPADLWVPIINDLSPSTSDQYSVGLDYSINSKFTLNVESYYKEVSNIIEYDVGRSFYEVNLQDDEPVFESFDKKIVSGDAKGYGIEFKLDGEIEKWSGWVSYSLSKTTHYFDDLNNGTPFPARYDRRHDFSTVVLRKLNRGRKLSLSWIYQSGINLSLPNGFGVFTVQPNNDNPKEVGLSSARNGFQAEATHRLDLSYSTFKYTSYGSKSWVFSIYNAYMRANPFYYEVKAERENGRNSPLRVGIYKIALYPIVPSVTLKINF